ncbi:TerD family protein [Embleya scabrispora]|uniref:TerD family protein n=1 Tax=Embleya scabrispora TaxID=159449 RepID=UPI0003600086|nr:TerD family protein [Embleya scabrispora]MYS82303.1 TerD family protein [Streptomyces sp. SID5474]
MSVTLAKGGNCPLAVAAVLVEVASEAPVDVSALLLGGSGKVRSDADFVFYNQPTGPGVRLRAGAPGRPAAVQVDTAAVPADVQTIVVTLSLDDGPGAPVTFGGTVPPTATVRDTSGEALVTFTPHGLGRETALVMLELYRRGGAWKVRAVGQGYANGLAGIATDFGVTVDDEPTPPPGRAGTQPSARPPGRAEAPPVPGDAPQTQATARPQAPTSDGPAPTPVAPLLPHEPPRPTPIPPPVPRRAATAQPTPPPTPAPPPPTPATPAPAPAPTSAATAPLPVGDTRTAGPINLDKGRVSLRKDQSVSLVKTGAPPLTRIRMGLGWAPAKAGSSIDLDASCIAFDAQGKKVVTVWFMKLSGLDGAIVHSGDNLTGEGEGDDESIVVRLDALPPHVTGLVFTVNSFLGQKFTEVSRAFCRLVDDTTDAELVRFDLSATEPRTGVLMCKLVREGAAWSMTALGRFADGRTVRKLVDPAREALGH